MRSIEKIRQGVKKQFCQDLIRGVLLWIPVYTAGSCLVACSVAAGLSLSTVGFWEMVCKSALSCSPFALSGTFIEGSLWKKAADLGRAAEDRMDREESAGLQAERSPHYREAA